MGWAGEARDTAGRWTSGAGAFVGNAADWVKSGGAQAALGKVVNEHTIKTGVEIGINSALYHIGQLDDPAMAVLEPYIHDAIHNGAMHMQVSVGVAREKMRSAVAKLIEARRAGK